VSRSSILNRLHENINHSPPDIYYVKRNIYKLEDCLEDRSKITNMLDRADQSYVKRFRTFGLEFSDLIALK
jgi:hypothetical protein